MFHFTYTLAYIHVKHLDSPTVKIGSTKTSISPNNNTGQSTITTTPSFSSSDWTSIAGSKDWLCHQLKSYLPNSNPARLDGNRIGATTSLNSLLSALIANNNGGVNYQHLLNWLTTTHRQQQSPKSLLIQRQPHLDIGLTEPSLFIDAKAPEASISTELDDAEFDDEQGREDELSSNLPNWWSKFPVEQSTKSGSNIHQYNQTDNQFHPLLHQATDIEGVIGGGRRKKTRTVFSRNQVSRLESTFNAKRYLSSSQRLELAKSLQLSETQIKIWFQNRRNKWKRQVGGPLIDSNGSIHHHTSTPSPPGVVMDPLSPTWSLTSQYQHQYRQQYELLLQQSQVKSQPIGTVHSSQPMALQFASTVLTNQMWSPTTPINDRSDLGTTNTTPAMINEKFHKLCNVTNTSTSTNNELMMMTPPVRH